MTMNLTPIVAHASGVDDMLVIYLPIILFILIAWIRARRAAKRREEEDR